MKRISLLLALLVLAAPASAFWGDQKPYTPTAEEEDLYRAASRLYRETARDKIAAIEMYERFLRRFPDSPRRYDAQFMAGEAHLDQALRILRKESESKKTDTARLLVQKNQAAVDALAQAKQAFERLLKEDRKGASGLAASAQYRLGEIAYNAKEWGQAIEAWRKVESDHRKSYIVPESWMGIIFANLALEQFSQAEANLFLLGETYPHYLRVPEVLYVQGIISLHKGDYANAERAFQRVKTPEAQFYLGKTYLLSKRPYLAARAFEALTREYPDSVLVEETEFFIGDSFFLAKDFDGAITKYRRFSAKYPQSQLRVSALFRIGSSYFQKNDYVQARAHFQSVIDRYPRDFFAPLAQYFIAESYLVEDQFREALFAYTKVITQYPETIKISPLAHYKLAWTQYNVSDYVQAAQTCRNFISLYPANELAKNVYIVMANSFLAVKRWDDAVTSFQRIIDLAPTSDVAEQALFSILQAQYKRGQFNAILTSYQFIFRHLPPSQSKWRPLSYLYAAEAYIAMNRVDEAKAIYEMILKVYPNESAAFYAQDGLAWAYQLLGNDAQALVERRRLQDMLDAAKSTYTISGVNQLGIADSMYNQKQYEDAYKLYDKFVAASPDAPQAPQAIYRAAMSLYHLRYYTQAIEYWTRLRDKYPGAEETPKAEYQIGDTLFRAQKYDEAIAQYQRISGKYAGSAQMPLAYLRIAMSHFNAKRDAETLNAALELLTKFRDVPEAVDALDLMEAVYDRNPKADFISSLRAVTEAVPGTKPAGEAQFRIARRLFERKEWDRAAEEFQRYSVDYTGGDKLSKAQFLLAESYFNAGKHQDAALAFERLLNNFPLSDDTALALFHLGSSLYQMKRYEAAARHYQRLIDEFPDSEYKKAGLFNLSLVYKQTGNLDRAEQTLAQYTAAAAEAADGSGEPALWELFTIQKDKKDYASALDTLGRVLDQAKTPETVQEATYRQGEIHGMMERPDDAVRLWEKLAMLPPKEGVFRLQGLIKLGEAYEAAEDWRKAIAVYNDLAKYGNTKEIRGAAAERAKGLSQYLKAGGAPSEPGPGDRYKTQVMPKDAGKAPAERKSAPRSAEKKGRSRKTETPAAKEINIPGMN